MIGKTLGHSGDGRSGGHGEVFPAEDSQLHRNVALTRSIVFAFAKCEKIFADLGEKIS
jgi:hypothetical protein